MDFRQVHVQIELITSRDYKLSKMENNDIGNGLPWYLYRQ